MKTYRLSNGQQKELMIRGQQLTIAIPTTDTDDSDFPLQYAKRCLPEHEEMIADAESQLIMSILPGAGEGVAGILGSISDAPSPSPGSIAVAIECVVATLRPPRWMESRRCHTRTRLCLPKPMTQRGSH